MSRRILSVIVAVTALGGAALANAIGGPDAPISAQLAPYLEGARDRARSSLGVAGLFPVRFVEAGCAVDGRAADLTFESGLASIRSYATIGFPSLEDWYAPGATTVIVGSTHPEIDPARSVDCDLVEIGPRG